MNNQPHQGRNYSASAHNVVGVPALQAWGVPNSAVAAASALGATTSPTPAANSSHPPLPRSTALLPIMEQHNRDLQEQLLESRAVIQQLCAQMMQEEERVSDLVEVNYLLSQQLQQLQQLQLQQLQGDQAEGSPQQQALPAHPQQQLQLQLPLLLGGQAGSHSTSSPGLLSPGPVTPSRVQLTESEAAAQAVTAACAGITIAAGIEPGPAGGAGPSSSQAAPAPPPRTPVAAAAGLYQLPSMNVGELGGLPHRSSSIQLSVDPGGPAAPHPSHLGVQCAAAAPPQGLAPLRTTPAPAGAAAAAAGVDLLPLPKLTLPARALRRKRSDTLDQEQCGDVSPQQVPAAPVAAAPIAAAAAGRHINDLDDTAAGSDAGRGIADRAVGQAAAVATLAAGLSGMPPVQPVPDSASSAHSAAVSAVAASLSGSDGSRGRAATPQLLTTHVAGAAGGQLPHLSPLMLVTPLVSCQVSPAEQLSPTRTSGAARGAPGAAGGTGPRVCPLPKLRLPAAVKPRGSPCSYSSSGSTPGSHKSDSAFFRSDELFDAALADASLGGSGEQLLGLVSLDGRSNPPMFSTSGSFDQRYGCQGGRDLPGGGTYMGDMGDAAGDTLGVSSWMGAWSEGGCDLHSSSGAHGCGTHMMYAQGQTALGGAAQELQDADTAAAALAQAAQQLDQVLVQQQQLLLRQKQQQQEQQQQQQQQQQGNAAAAAAVGLAAKMVVSPLPAPAPPPLADALPHLLPPLRTQRRLSNEDHGSGGSSTHQGRTPDLMVPGTAAATSTSSPGGASSPGHTAVYTPVSLAIEEELTAAESDTPPAAAAAAGGGRSGDALVQGGTSSGCSPTAAAAGVEAGEGRGGLLERGMPSRPPSASPFAAASQQQQPPAAGPATGGATGGRSCSGRLAVQRSGSIPSPMRRLPPLHIPPAGSQASCSSFAPAPAGPDAMLPAAPAGGATAAAAPAAGGGGNGGHAEGPWPYRQLRITTHHVLGSSVEAPSSTATPARVPSSGNLRQGIPPPSPGGATRYVPGSPCIVGFDCTTPVFLRSPSWRSEAGGDSAAAPSCCSGASTPKRQPASPGLLAQVLSRSSLAGGGSGGNSGASTPLTARARRGSGVFGAQYPTPQRTSSNASMGCTTPGGNGSSAMGGHGQPVLHLHGAPGPMDSSVLARSSMLASGMLPPAFHGQQQQPGHMRQRSLPELPTVSHLCDAHHPGYHHPQQQQQPHLMMPSAGASGAGSGVASSSRGVPTPRTRSGRSAAAAVDGSSSGRGLEGQGVHRRQHGTDSSSVSGGSSPGDQPPDISAAAAAAAAGGGGSGACLGLSNTAVAAVAALRGSPGVSNGSSTSAAAAAAAGQQRDLALNLQDMVSPRASPRHSSPRGRPGSTTPTGAAGNAAVHGSGGAHAGPRTMSRLSRAIDSQGRRSNRCGALAFEEDAEGCAHQQQQQQAEEEEQQHHQQRRRHARSRHVTWRVSEAGEEGQDGSDTSSGGSSSSNSQAEGCQAAATAAEGQAVCDVLVEAGAAAPGRGAPAAAEPAGATDEEAPLAAPSATAAAATAAAAGGTAPVAPAQAPNTTSSSRSSSSTITSSPHDAEPAPADPSPPDALRECGLVTAVEVCPAQQQQASLGDVLSVLGDQGLDTPVVTRVLETPQQVLCSSGKQRSSYVPGYIGDAASAIRQCKQKAAVGAHHYAPQLPAAASSGGGGRPRAARSDPADDHQQQQRPCTGITASAAASASAGSEEFRNRLHMFAAAAEAAAAANSAGASLASSRCSSAAPTPRVSEQGAEEAPSPGKHQHQQQQSMQQAQQQLAVMPGAQPGVTSRVLPTAMVGSGSCGAGASPKGTPGICPVSSQSGALGGSSSSSRDVLDCARQPDQSAAAKPCTAPSGSKSSGRSQGTAGRGSGVNAGAGSAASAPAEVFPAPGIEAHGTSSSSSVQQQPQQEEEQQHRVLDETSVGTPHAAAAPAQGGVQPVPDAAPPAAHASHLHPYQQQQQVVTSAALFARNLPHLLVLPAPEEGPASPPASPASASSRASSSSSGLGDAEDDRSSRSSAGGCSSPCGSSSSLDDDLLLSLHVPAQGGVGEVLLQMGVSVDSGAMRVARAQQQALMMRRHQQRQQALEALRSRQHLEQHQRQQQLAGEGDQGAQAVPGDLAAPGGSARPSHRPREGSGRLGTSHAALSQRLLNPVRRLSGWRLPDVTWAASASSSSRALGSSATGGCADAGAVLEREGSMVEDGRSAGCGAGGSRAVDGGLDGLPRELPTPSDDPADVAFTPGHFYAARHAPTTAAAAGAGGGGLQGTTSGGLGGRPAEDEDDGASMYSMGQQSGVSWSTSSQVNRTPRLEWWGKEGRYFSGRTPGFGPVREAGRAGAGNDAGSSSREASQQVAAADGSSGAASAGRARGQVWAAPTRVGALVAGVTTSVTRAMGPRLHQVTRYVLGARGGRSDSSAGEGTSSGKEGSDSVAVEAGGPSGTAAAAHQ